MQELGALFKEHTIVISLYIDNLSTSTQRIYFGSEKRDIKQLYVSMSLRVLCFFFSPRCQGTSF